MVTMAMIEAKKDSVPLNMIEPLKAIGTRELS